jgi:hypothetical protein
MAGTGSPLFMAGIAKPRMRRRGPQTPTCGAARAGATCSRVQSAFNASANLRHDPLSAPPPCVPTTRRNPVESMDRVSSRPSGTWRSGHARRRQRARYPHPCDKCLSSGLSIRLLTSRSRMPGPEDLYEIGFNHWRTLCGRSVRPHRAPALQSRERILQQPATTWY